MLKRLLTPLLWLLLATAAAAQVEPPAVTGEQLDAAVAQLSASGLAQDDPQRAALLKTYADTRAALQSYQKFAQARKEFGKAHANASGEARAIREQIARDEDKAAEYLSRLDRLSLQELDQRIQLDKAELDAQKSRLSEVSAAIDGMPARAEAIRNRMTQLVAAAADLEASKAKGGDGTPAAGSQAEAQQWLQEAEAASVAAEKAALDEELLSQPMRLELRKAQQAQASLRIDQLSRIISSAEQRASELRQGEAARVLAETEQAVRKTLGKHPVLQELADRNAQLSASLVQISADVDSARQRQTEVVRKSEELDSDLKSIERRLQVVGMSVAVGAVLREREAQLPTTQSLTRAVAQVDDAVGQANVRQMDWEEEAHRLRDARSYTSELLATVSPPVSAEVESDLLQLVRMRRDLISRAIDLESTYTRALGDLSLALHGYIREVGDYREFVAARLLWIPSRERFSLFHGTGLHDQLVAVFNPERWLRLLTGLPAEMLRHPLACAGLLLGLLLFLLSPRLFRALAATGDEVGYVRTDRFVNTLYALGLTALLALRWPIVVYCLAWFFELHEQEPELSTALHLAGTRMAWYLLGLSFLRLLFVPKGLFDRHFRWSGKRTAELYHRVIRLEQTYIPALFLGILALDLYPREVGGALGSATLVIVLLSIARFFHATPEFMRDRLQSLYTGREAKPGSLIGRIIRQLLVWVPVAATGAVVFGYTYTAIEIVQLLVKTIVLNVVLLLLYDLGLRWLRITRRRMVARMHSEATRGTGGDGEVTAEEELLESDPELLNSEGTKLLNLLLLMAGLLGLVWIWSDILPAFGFLDAIELWHYTGQVNGQELPVPVTLQDLLVAVLITVVSWILLRRIPGLLEILLRQRMKVSPATAYAATRVFQYAATTILVLVVLSALGGSWSQIQWAVAALSVGIGFGLQEIVANFISGLIILFEQPIRLGDVVTVGDVSGTVTRIRIRATTIRDFDRKELLVPNKEFITSRLLNWSLSDQVTRLTLEVGVAYGTDLDRAIAIVQEVADQHPLVMRDPRPFITFEEFGDNSLLLQMRLFVDQLDKRLAIASELRLEINRRFNAEGIVVAFPQRDVHLDTSRPLDIRLVDDAPGSPDA